MTRPISALDVPLPVLREQIAALVERQTAQRADRSDQNPNTVQGDAVSETRIAGTTIGLGDDHDRVWLDTRNGHLVISLAPGIDLVCDHADQATLDKLATVTANAAAVNRSRSLKEVA
jgi:hypothetical protein